MWVDDARNFIASQEQHADLLIEVEPIREIENPGDPAEVVETFLELGLENSLHLDPLLDRLAVLEALSVSHRYEEDDRQHVTLRGRITSGEVELIASEVVPGLEEIGVDNPNWQDGMGGLLQLFVCYYIFESAEMEIE